MWPSTQSTNGNIGGVNGATTICEMDAPAISGLAAGLIHRAVIATSANDPRNYFSNNPPVQRPNGTVITDTYADFFDPAVVNARNSIAINVSFIWSGIANNGTPSIYNCLNWTNSSGSTYGERGENAETNTNRFNGSDYECNSSYRILCISY